MTEFYVGNYPYDLMLHGMSGDYNFEALLRASESKEKADLVMKKIREAQNILQSIDPKIYQGLSEKAKTEVE